MIFENYAQTLYSCPMVELSGYSLRHSLSAKILAYISFGGVTGSYNDALASGILSIAKENGVLAKGQPIVEASCGSFAAALAVAAAQQGHTLTLVIPMGLPLEWSSYLQELGAKLIVCGSQTHQQHKQALEEARSSDGYFVNYFDNEFNVEFHRRITGPAIMQNMSNELDAVVIGVGSGGTVSGVGESIKAYLPDVKIVAVEPYESQAIGGGIIGRHAIRGLGAGFVPENYNEKIVDKVVAVSSAAAQATAKELLKNDGIPADSSCGAVLCAAKELSRANPSIKNIACVFGARTMNGPV